MAAVAHARGGVAAAEEGRVQQQREAAAAAAAAAEEEGRVQQQQREAVVAAAAAAEEGRGMDCCDLVARSDSNAGLAAKNEDGTPRMACATRAPTPGPAAGADGDGGGCMRICRGGGCSSSGDRRCRFGQGTAEGEGAGWS